MADTFKPLLARLVDGRVLSADEAHAFFAACLRGEPTPAQVAAAVTALRIRGETVEEIAAFATAMREAAKTLDHPYDAIDTCGTGGDGQHTFNISTAAALVLAGAGLKVAKHGNRAMSSKSGSSDVLSVLGVNLQASPAQQRRSLDEAGIAFLFAPAYHGAMRHVGPVRAEIGFRTVFNLLGPLSNPAGAKRQVMGVYDPRLLEPLAEVLGRLGATRAWTVHGQGLDELTTTGETEVAEWKDGAVRRFTVTPEEAGLPRADLAALRGGDAEENAAALRALLDGTAGAYRDIVLLNAAAALVVADRAHDLADGAALAAAVIDDGRAAKALADLVEATNAVIEEDPA
ncbi:MAG: anthranilate phosphoribosyltransferase [Alphaproteobacteria bacterium]|jgi:anthranilate phosphoribosyltransferase|nr:anthranilate phosphoribosyltransferase [Alphaproteobacteria bacterium]MBU2042699.1 anthranilate phosphoribosyltransferase [Alphaproteobacteria bacterium]MBU2126178.1 anthranilate phosphoribosyltransferase [Alphaproteobacteria bacterium]MBU2208898.1 anthranilate phosphoribosyltransferase [Alphaproteobacteria bacterium]MBU2290114.1 anthranilate phosphoribosyltransferase [Alphaproteobacteria bacterium]